MCARFLPSLPQDHDIIVAPANSEKPSLPHHLIMSKYDFEAILALHTYGVSCTFRRASDAVVWCRCEPGDDAERRSS